MPHRIRLLTRLARVGGWLPCVLWSAACRDPAPLRTEPQGNVGSSATQALTPVEPAPTGAHTPSAAEASGAGASRAPRRELDPRLYPPDRPLQHLAFSDERLAQLEQGELSVRSLPDLRRLARVATPGARNVVAGVGGDFVAAGSDHVYRLARLDRHVEVLAPVPRLGPTTILPAADSSDHFWLLYAGIQALPEFDLQETVLTRYVSVLGWSELTGFDGRSLSSAGDGSFVYTTALGVRRRDAAGGSEQVSLGAWGAQIWLLLPGAGPSTLWAATPAELHLLQPRWRVVGAPSPEADVTRRIELPAHTVALASGGSNVAVLAVERFEPSRVHLRVEIHTAGAAERRVLTFDDALPTPPAAGAVAAPPPPFLPELALAPGRPWVAVFGFQLAVFDWRSGKQLFPPADRSKPSQNLAPGSQ